MFDGLGPGQVDYKSRKFTRQTGLRSGSTFYANSNLAMSGPRYNHDKISAWFHVSLFYNIKSEGTSAVRKEPFRISAFLVPLLCASSRGPSFSYKFELFRFRETVEVATGTFMVCRKCENQRKRWQSNSMPGHGERVKGGGGGDVSMMLPDKWNWFDFRVL